MASTTTLGKERAIIIRLQYNNDGTVTSYHNDGTVATPDNPLRFQQGDSVVFVSVTGGEVYVNLNSPAYKPDVFPPKSGAVDVIAPPTGKTRHVQCGFVEKENGEEMAYGWLPDSVAAKFKPEYRRAIQSGIDMDP